MLSIGVLFDERRIIYEDKLQYVGDCNREGGFEKIRIKASFP